MINILILVDFSDNNTHGGGLVGSVSLNNRSNIVVGDGINGSGRSFIDVRGRSNVSSSGMSGHAISASRSHHGDNHENLIDFI